MNEFLRQNYSWSFLAGEYAHPGPELTTRHVIIGHELGTWSSDGLRSEGVQAGLGRRALDTLYAQTIERASGRTGSPFRQRTWRGRWLRGRSRLGVPHRWMRCEPLSASPSSRPS